MEIKFEKDIEIEAGNIIGVIDEDRYFYNYLENLLFNKPVITVDSKKLNKTETRAFRKKISFVESYICDDYLNLSVYEYMKYSLINQFLVIKDYNKKIKDSLKIVGLDSKYLNKKISLLSLSEQRLVLFAISLLSNPNMIVFDNFFEGLDLKTTKFVINILSQLAEQYNKTFFTSSSVAKSIKCSYVALAFSSAAKSSVKSAIKSPVAPIPEVEKSCPLQSLKKISLP